MTVVLSETEADPAGWPAVTVRFPNRPTDDDNPDVAAAATWRRLEGWIARRWPSRSVVWTVEGPGEWSPRLYPFTLSTAEVWSGGAWSAVTLEAAPLGYMLEAETYRISGTAGDDADPPEDVLEAFRRLHEYGLGVARSWWTETATYRSEDHQAVAAWAAKAMHLSGAADLLRPYRRLGA